MCITVYHSILCVSQYILVYCMYIIVYHSILCVSQYTIVYCMYITVYHDLLEYGRVHHSLVPRFHPREGVWWTSGNPTMCFDINYLSMLQLTDCVLYVIGSWKFESKAWGTDWMSPDPCLSSLGIQSLLSSAWEFNDNLLPWQQSLESR